MAQFALMAGFGLAQAGLSAFAASARNDAIEAQMRANNARAAEEIARQEQVASLRTAQLRRSAGRALGLVAVSAADRGVGTDGSTAAIGRNLAIDQEYSQYGLDLEHYGAERNTLASLSLTNDGLAGQGQSIGMAAIGGAIQGAQTGLSIGSGISDLQDGGYLRFLSPGDRPEA